MKNRFERLTGFMVKDIDKKIKLAKSNKDWGRVLTLEGFRNGLTQSLANYRIVFNLRGEK